MAEPSLRRLGPGSRVSDRYRLERVIGTGGMGVVWRATDELLGRPVAVKLLSGALPGDPAYLARFEREARLAAGISHPNLVSVYDYGASAPPHLVMEYVDGGTLAARLRHGAIDPAVVPRLAADLLSALACVHDAGILHRDVKPANVLLGSDGRARLTDFGVARLEDSTSLTQSGHVVGTLRYLAPEVVSGRPPSPAADLYALGILLREVSEAVEVDEQVRALADWLAASEARERPQDAGQALAWLERRELTGAAAGEATGRPATAPTRVVHPRPVWPKLAAGLALALILVAVILALTAGGGGRGPSRSTPAPAPKTLQQWLQRLEQSVRSAGSS